MAYDPSMHEFAYHVSRSEKPATCAGFLPRGATYEIGVRLVVITGKIGPITLRDRPLHSYRAMAEAAC